MSLVKDVLKGLVEKGVIEHVAEIQGVTFRFRPLTTEEVLLSDSMSTTTGLKKKYKADDQLQTYPDTVAKYRNVAMLSFSIASIDGKEPVDKSLSVEQQFAQRTEFRDELLELSPEFIDALLKEQRELSKKQFAFYDNLEENVGK